MPCSIDPINERLLRENYLWKSRRRIFLFAISRLYFADVYLIFEKTLLYFHRNKKSNKKNKILYKPRNIFLAYYYVYEIYYVKVWDKFWCFKKVYWTWQNLIVGNVCIEINALDYIFLIFLTNIWFMFSYAKCIIFIRMILLIPCVNLLAINSLYNLFERHIIFYFYAIYFLLCYIVILIIIFLHLLFHRVEYITVK